MDRQRVRLISVYARRPKVKEPAQNHILVKLNAQLFEFARRAAPLGIPVFAGVPLASSLASLGLDVQCSWLRLKPEGTHDRDIEFSLTLDGVKCGDDHGCADWDGPLQPDQLVESVLDSTESVPWERAVENLKQIQSGVRNYGRWPFFGGYKPFYLLLFDH